MAIQEYFRNSIVLDAEQVQNGCHNLPGLKKLTLTICKNLNRYANQSTEQRKLRYPAIKGIINDK